MQAFFVGHDADPVCYRDIPAQVFVDLFKERSQAVASGDVSCLIEMLVAQTSMLQSIMVNEINRGIANTDALSANTHTRTALRAQKLCAQTIEIIGGLVVPGSRAKTVFAKQANIAGGHQQVVNHPGDDSGVVKETPERRSKKALSQQPSQNSFSQPFLANEILEVANGEA